MEWLQGQQPPGRFSADHIGCKHVQQNCMKEKRPSRGSKKCYLTRLRSSRSRKLQCIMLQRVRSRKLLEHSSDKVYRILYLMNVLGVFGHERDATYFTVIPHQNCSSKTFPWQEHEIGDSPLSSSVDPSPMWTPRAQTSIYMSVTRVRMSMG